MSDHDRALLDLIEGDLHRGRLVDEPNRTAATSLAYARTFAALLVVLGAVGGRLLLGSPDERALGWAFLSGSTVFALTIYRRAAPTIQLALRRIGWRSTALLHRHLTTGAGRFDRRFRGRPRQPDGA